MSNSPFEGVMNAADLLGTRKEIAMLAVNEHV